jgi:hypothetical protein
MAVRLACWQRFQWFERRKFHGHGESPSAVGAGDDFGGSEVIEFMGEFLE